MGLDSRPDAFALHLAASWSAFDDNSASSPLGPEQEGKIVKAVFGPPRGQLRQAIRRQGGRLA